MNGRTYGGLADSRGYVLLGDQLCHVEFLRRSDVRLVASITGLSIEQLLGWADGVAMPLGLWRERGGPRL